MSQPSLAQSRTVALPFVRLVQDHPHLFQVNPGVDATKKLKQKEIGEAFGLPQQTINAILNGKNWKYT